MAQLPVMLDRDKHGAVLAKYGIRPADIVAPAAHVTPKSGFDALCIQEYPIYSDAEQTQRIANDGHTGPLMFLDREDRTEATGAQKSAYDGYEGFSIIKALHPERGEIVITYSLADEERGKSDLTAHLDSLVPGNLFQVARIKTRSGNRIFIPVNVQGPAGQ